MKISTSLIQELFFADFNVTYVPRVVDVPAEFSLIICLVVVVFEVAFGFTLYGITFFVIYLKIRAEVLFQVLIHILPCASKNHSEYILRINLENSNFRACNLMIYKTSSFLFYEDVLPSNKCHKLVLFVCFFQ